MIKQFRVILDADDTLFKCNSEAIKKLNDEYGCHFTVNDITSWGLLNNELDNRLKYFKDPIFIKNLPLMKGAKEFVHKLSEKAEIFVCTNVNPECVFARFSAIIENFPEIKPENIIFGGRKDLLIADMMLDDALHNLEKANVKYPVLFQQPWNFENNSILSVDGYSQFLELVEIIKNASTMKKERVQMVSIIGPSGSGKHCIVNEICKNSLFEKVKAYSTNPNNTSYNYIPMEEFTNAKLNDFFTETSIYCGNYYGIRREDINYILQKGKIPIMVLDINGAMTVSSLYNSLNVFVSASKEDCIKNIIQDDSLSLCQKTQRIIALDLEQKNENLCDITVTKNDVDKIIRIVKGE